MCPEREFRDASGWIQTRVAFSGHTFAGVLPMPHGPWMRIAIAAAGLAALCITMRPAIAREPEKGPDTGQRPVARSYGQYLVERTRTRHPELIGLDLHATPPNAPRSVVIASLDRDRVGRESDVRALEVVKTSKPAVAVDGQTGQRIEVDVPLQDKSGNIIGAMQAVYAYAKGEDEARFLTQAEALRGEMQRQIPTVAKLVQPVRPTEGLDIGGTQSLPTTKEIVSGKALAENEQEGYAEAVKHVAGVAPANPKASSACASTGRRRRSRMACAGSAATVSSPAPASTTASTASRYRATSNTTASTCPSRQESACSIPSTAGFPSRPYPIHAISFRGRGPSTRPRPPTRSCARTTSSPTTSRWWRREAAPTRIVRASPPASAATTP